jgi:hypothetical protein
MQRLLAVAAAPLLPLSIVCSIKRLFEVRDPMVTLEVDSSPCQFLAGERRREDYAY